MTFAVLTTAELRLVDVLLKRGVFSDPPVSILRPDHVPPAGADSRGLPHLRERIPQIAAISRPLGDVLAQGSVAELLRLWTRPPGRDPTND